MKLQYSLQLRIPIISIIVKQIKTEFYIKKYELLCNETSRIKEDEQRWINILLLIYGAMFTYIATLDYKSHILFTWLLLATFLLSLFWLFHATTVLP
jgi:hypothetical protein